MVPSIDVSYEIFSTENIGFFKIPQQLEAFYSKYGYSINLMVVGRRGLGASTLINSLFSASLMTKDRPNSISTTVNEIIEGDVKLKVSITSYHEENYQEAVDYINTKYKDYFDNEQHFGIKLHDKRIHACLYLLPADRLTNNEITGLKAISEVCNLILVITKADTYTEEEIKLFKSRMQNVVVTNNINIYDFEKNEIPFNIPSGIVKTHMPESEHAAGINNSDKTCSNNIQNSNIDAKEIKILSTIASEKTYDFRGNIIRGRKYQWGFIDISNEAYSDFKRLQRILLQTSFEELLFTTDTIYYNTYRKSMPKNKKLTDGRSHDILKQRLVDLKQQLENVVKKRNDGACENPNIAYDAKVHASYNKKTDISSLNNLKINDTISSKNMSTDTYIEKLVVEAYDESE